MPDGTCTEKAICILLLALSPAFVQCVLEVMEEGRETDSVSIEGSNGDSGSEATPDLSGGSTGEEAFVTMVTSDDFVIGAEVMLHSLREHSDPRIRRPRVVIVTSGVSQIKRRVLEAVADDVVEVTMLA